MGVTIHLNIKSWLNQSAFPFDQQIKSTGWGHRLLDVILTTCLVHCSSIFLSVGCTLEWIPRPENHFLQKEERSLPRKLMVSSQIYMMHVPDFSPSIFKGHVSSVQIPRQPNLLGNQVVNQVERNPTNPSTAQRKRTGHGSLEIMARNITASLALKVMGNHRRGRNLHWNQREEKKLKVGLLCWSEFSLMLNLAFEIAFLCLLFGFISNFQHDTKHSCTIIDTILKVYIRYAMLQFMLKSSPPPITWTTPSWL